MGQPLDLCEKAIATPEKLPSLHTKGDHNISRPVVVKVLPEKVCKCKLTDHPGHSDTVTLKGQLCCCMDNISQKIQFNKWFSHVELYSNIL